MRIEYEPNLVEQAVLCAARQDAALMGQLHGATDPLYQLTDSTQQESRFRETYAGFFRRLGFDEVLPRLLEERPLIAEHVGRCIARQAANVRKEAAELYVKDEEESPSPSTRSLFIFVTPDSLLKPKELEYRMQSELLHTADMLDYRFGYVKDSLAGHHPRQNLIRDRYRVLWDIFVEGRLHREGRRDPVFDPEAQTPREAEIRLQEQLSSVFGRAANGRTAEAFAHVFGAVDLTHGQMLTWAQSPAGLFESSAGANAKQSGGPDLGGPCPLCAFTTYDWVTPSDLSSATIPAIQSDFPAWQPHDGVCRQCAEIYTHRPRACEISLAASTDEE